MKVGGKSRVLKSNAQTKRSPEGDLSVALTEVRLRAVTADHDTAPLWRAVYLRSTRSLCEAKKLTMPRGTSKALRQRHGKARTGKLAQPPNHGPVRTGRRINAGTCLQNKPGGVALRERRSNNSRRRTGRVAAEILPKSCHIGGHSWFGARLIRRKWWRPWR